MAHPAPTRSPLVNEAIAHLRASMPTGGGTYAVLLSVGAGDHATAIAAELRFALARDPRIVFVGTSLGPGAPVSDPTNALQHVDSEREGFVPWPSVVVRVSEVNGQVSIAARLPGRDPLGPPEDGWTWQVP